MACPNCDHTMQKIATAPAGDKTYWCPRCGTIRRELWSFPTPIDERPKLVCRVRQFLRTFTRSEYRAAIDAHRLGVVESCLPPGNRPIDTGDLTSANWTLE
jgi:hypothetical protein